MPKSLRASIRAGNCLRLWRGFFLNFNDVEVIKEILIEISCIGFFLLEDLPDTSELDIYKLTSNCISQCFHLLMDLG